MATARKKPTKAQLAAQRKTRQLRNPITGQGPNQFTAVSEGRTLPAPKNVQKYQRPLSERHRLRELAVAQDENLDAPVGYRYDAIDERYKTFVQGARHMFPNTAAEKGVPAINEPHKHDPGVTVQRRAEDLSGKEYRKGEQVLKQFGFDPADPVGHLQSLHGRTLDRVAAEHIVSGVEESASQLFYGGRSQSDFPQIEHAVEHEEHVKETPDLFDTKVRNVVNHPDFVNATAHLSHPERISAARNLMASAGADTSPNNMWKQVKAKDPSRRHPNLEQADEVVHATLEGRPAGFRSGRIQNVPKAQERVQDALDTGDFGVHKYGDPFKATKTIAFRGALVDKDSSDAFRVADVHDASVMAHWLPTAKSHMYRNPRTDKRKAVYPDEPESATKGMVQEFKTTKHGKIKPDWGLSRPEQMLGEGQPMVHAMNDYATRRVLASRGLSRGVNYADNVHTAQAAMWGSQQMRRPDLDITPAEQYPVARHWEAEGVNVPADPHDPLGSLRRGQTNVTPGAQFHHNPRTGRTNSVFDLD